MRDPVERDVQRPGRSPLTLTALALALVAVATSAAGVQAGRSARVATGPVELGVVAWERDYERAAARARASDRPLFVLFQEVPGCSTCVGFGETVLSHPLVVEAIESEFVPLAILNNRPGADRAVLERFGEPAWNNPVVRFVDAEGRDLIPRRDAVWSRAGIAKRMVRSLETAARSVPPYLELVAQSPEIHAGERATLAMHCFWTGEACLGGLDGVLSSRPGWIGGREVVELRFDETRLAYRELLTHARDAGCADTVFVHDAAQRAVAETIYGDAVVEHRAAARPARESDHYRHLRHSRYAALDLLPLQATRINAALAAGADPEHWLSPRQRAAVASRRTP